MRPLHPPSTERQLARALQRLRALERRGPGEWHTVGATGEPAFQNGHTDAGSPWFPTRFRLTLSGGFEYVININVGTPLTVVYNLPDGFYDTDGDVPIHGFDDSGNALAFKVVAATGGGFTAGDVVHLGP